MSHRMRPLFPSKFAGIALTVKLKKEENRDPAALNGMLAAIDQGGPNSVYVMVVEDGANIAGMGGLMGTSMAAYAILPTSKRLASRYSRWEPFLQLPSIITGLPAQTFQWYAMAFRFRQ